MKRTILTLVLLLLVGGAALVLQKDYVSEEIFLKEARSLPATKKCLEGSRGLKFSKPDLEAVQTAVVKHIVDVPEGTQADIKFNSSTPSEVTGSILYAKSYGRYNFLMVKDADTSQWKFKSFEACTN